MSILSVKETTPSKSYFFRNPITDINFEIIAKSKLSAKFELQELLTELYPVYEEMLVAYSVYELVGE